MACSCPIFVLGRLKKKEEEEDGENHGFSVFRIIITLAMYFRQFVSVIGDSYTMVRYL